MSPAAGSAQASWSAPGWGHLSGVAPEGWRKGRQIAELTASDGAAGANFGRSVATSADGSTAIIAEYGEPYAAYVFSDKGGTWKQTAELTAPGKVPFTGSAAISADGATVLIGAFTYNQAYVFTDTGGTWTQTAVLTPSDGAEGDYFGIGLALSADGSTAVVGAQNADSYTGAAYVFTQRSKDKGWRQVAKLTASDGSPYEGFGDSVAVSSDGTTALVGAPDQRSYIGAVYVFSGTGRRWGQKAKLTASDHDYANDFFGISVGISSDGSTAIVGSPGSRRENGAAYVFTDAGGKWELGKELVASDHAENNVFGNSVAISSDGSTVVVGANWRDDETGAIYVFHGKRWGQKAELTASDGAAGDSFGNSVAISSDGSTALVGASGRMSAEGAVYVFER